MMDFHRKFKVHSFVDELLNTNGLRGSPYADLLDEFFPTQNFENAEVFLYWLTWNKVEELNSTVALDVGYGSMGGDFEEFE